MKRMVEHRGRRWVVLFALLPVILTAACGANPEVTPTSAGAQEDSSGSELLAKENFTKRMLEVDLDQSSEDDRRVAHDPRL